MKYEDIEAGWRIPSDLDAMVVKCQGLLWTEEWGLGTWTREVGGHFQLFTVSFLQKLRVLSNSSYHHVFPIAFPGVSMVKNSSTKAEDVGSASGSGRSPGVGNGNPLQYLPGRILWTEDPGRLQSLGSQRVGHDWATKQQQQHWLKTT